jgi:3-methyladenine DNA glycosylase AlkD
MEIARSNIKLFSADEIAFFESLIIIKSWWDTVDYIAANIIGPILSKLPKKNWRMYSETWILSDNLWLQRTSITFQLFYKKDTDFNLLTDNILATLANEDFFIRKAAGWALRHHTRTNKHAVLHFLDEYGDVLSPLTKTEAMKLLVDK